MEIFTAIIIVASILLILLGLGLCKAASKPEPLRPEEYNGAKEIEDPDKKPRD
jgi:hypothetical protein